jgi:DNA invertase Pin-like site-specific DNA recombinase
MSKRTSGQRVALYLRVSTTKQTVTNQKRELDDVAQRNGWQVVRVFKDHGISGTKGRDQRPGFNELLQGISRRDFDRIAVWSTDRLGRSMPQLVQVLEELKAKGMHLYDHKHGIDTSTPMGQAFYYMSGIFAEIERDMIVERVKAGLRKAKAEGTKSGRPFGRPRISPEIEGQIREQLALGIGIHRVAKIVGCGSGTVQRLRTVVLREAVAP